MTECRPQLSEDQIVRIATAAQPPREMYRELQDFLQLLLDEYRYRLDANTDTPSRRDVRSTLEKLVVDTKTVLNEIRRYPWVRPGLEGFARYYEGLMYRSGSRNSQQMLADAEYGLEWIQRAASEWLDHLSRVERGYPPPVELRGSADEFLLGELLWFWVHRLNRKIIKSETSQLTKFIVACFSIAGTEKTPQAIRKQIERHGKPRRPARRSQRPRG